MQNVNHVNMKNFKKIYNDRKIQFYLKMSYCNELNA